MDILYESSVGAELYHHGILGMKWGVRRFQNSDGSLTAAGKKRYETAESKKEQRLKRKEEKAARKAEKKESDKATAIANGDVKRILDHVGSMTTAEINDALNRSRYIQQMRDMAAEPTRFEKFNGFTKKVSDVTSGTANAISGVKKLADALKKEEKLSEEERAAKEGRLQGIKEAAKNKAMGAKTQTAEEKAASEGRMNGIRNYFQQQTEKTLREAGETKVSEASKSVPKTTTEKLNVRMSEYADLTLDEIMKRRM